MPNNFIETKYSNNLSNIINTLPNSPGCYLFKDKDNNLLYVGKSKNIKSRVKSYFRSKSDLSARIGLMVQKVSDIEFIVTETEAEALNLESNLIKSKQPYFNVLLKDDKKYPYLCITWSDEYPRIFITRRRRNRNTLDKYYGPFVDVAQLRNTLLTVKKVFPIRQRPVPLYKNRTCLNYDIGMCPGVCQKLIPTDIYRKTLKNIEMIFQGRSDSLDQHLMELMNNYSEQQKFEKAAEVRDQISALHKIVESQNVSITDSSVNRDAINCSIDKDICSIQIFQMRSGKLVNRLGYIYDTHGLSKEIILQNVIDNHYSNLDKMEIPTEILIPFETPNISYMRELITSLKGSKINITIPKRNEKAKLLFLVKKNTDIELNRIKQGQEKNVLELEDLTQILELNQPPFRIEGYDISHIQGSHPVASQVVFINGIPAKQHYRKYLIKEPSITLGHSDDYLALSEVIERRFRRWSSYKKNGLSLNKISIKKSSPLDPINLSDWPDLVLIDGGKGQLNAVMNKLNEMDLASDLNICSLAKKQELIFVPGSTSPLPTDKDQLGILLLRRIRDEAHRFALSFHRNKRSKSMRRSYLVEIPGIGPTRIKSLLSHFNSLQAIKLASVDDISKVNGIGNELAKEIWRYFNPD